MGRREADSRGAMNTSDLSELGCLQDATSSSHHGGEQSPRVGSRCPCNADKRQRNTDTEAPVQVKKHQHKHNLKHRYEVMETLGKGTYGKVKRAVERASMKTVSYVCWYLNNACFFFSMNVINLKMYIFMNLL